jgi:hypothetical protein
MRHYAACLFAMMGIALSRHLIQVYEIHGILSVALLSGMIVAVFFGCGELLYGLLALLWFRLRPNRPPTVPARPLIVPWLLRRLGRLLGHLRPAKKSSP